MLSNPPSGNDDPPSLNSCLRPPLRCGRRLAGVAGLEPVPRCIRWNRLVHGFPQSAGPIRTLCALGGLCAGVFARLACWLAQSRRSQRKTNAIAAGIPPKTARNPRTCYESLNGNGLGGVASQGASQMPVTLGHDLAQVVTAWDKLSAPLKAAILAIVKTATNEGNR